MTQYKITGGRIITPHGITHGCILVDDGVITHVGADVSAPDYAVIDARGQYISPGFIDIHQHGGGGYDYMDATPDAYLGILREHMRHGATSVVPTTLAASFDEIATTCAVYNQVAAMDLPVTLLGLHLEGPYFSLEQRGAQDPRYIRNPSPDEYGRILSLCDGIVRWSIAPELDGALALGRRLSSVGILPSAAHTDATYDEMLAAYDSGYTHITHLYSGMPPVRRIHAHRVAGPIEAAYLLDGMTVEIIADGVHLPPPLLKLIYKIKGSTHIALCTDAMRGAGQTSGESIIGSLTHGQQCIIADGVAYLPDRSAFAGSVATCDRLVRTMVTMADVPLREAVTMMTLTPATILNAHRRKGSLSVGKDADIILFNDNIHVSRVMHGGTFVWEASHAQAEL